jgi:hypothetical protein
VIEKKDTWLVAAAAAAAGQACMQLEDNASVIIWRLGN